MTRCEDIIYLPHHVSERHARMSMMDRAAQFSPFAALTGYDAAIKEAARLTDAKIELDESEKEILDLKLREATECGKPVRITHFLPDERKAGGAYVCTTGRVKKLDTATGSIVFENGACIMTQNLVDIAENFEK